MDMCISNNWQPCGMENVPNPVYYGRNTREAHGQHIASTYQLLNTTTSDLL